MGAGFGYRTVARTVAGTVPGSLAGRLRLAWGTQVLHTYSSFTLVCIKLPRKHDGVASSSQNRHFEFFYRCKNFNSRYKISTISREIATTVPRQKIGGSIMVRQKISSISLSPCFHMSRNPQVLDTKWGSSRGKKAALRLAWSTPTCTRWSN